MDGHPAGDGEHAFAVADEEGREAEGEDRVVEGGSEVLPEGRGGSWVVGGEQERCHVDQSEEACGSRERSEEKRDADGEFSVGDEEGDGGCVRENDSLQDRQHERVGAVLDEAVDPVLEASVQGELRAEDFVLSEDQEEASDGNA